MFTHRRSLPEQGRGVHDSVRRGANAIARLIAAMLKILHVITGLRRGGAEAALARLVSATREQFDHVVISLRDEAHFGPILRAQGVPVFALDVGTSRGALGGIRALMAIISMERPSVVQTWMYHADVFGGIAARLVRCGSVVWGVRNTDLRVAAIGWSARLAASLSAPLSRFVPDVITCNSHRAQSAHVAFGYKQALFHIIENGYDVRRFQPDQAGRAAIRAEFAVAPQQALIGLVARWDPQKDHRNLLSAMKHVLVLGHDIRLLLVGTGMDRANRLLMEIVRESALEKRVMLAGPRDDVPAIMNALDLHVLASSGEAFPNVVAEAMSCGTPCVVTDVGDAAHIVGDTGWVARPGDPAALAAATSEALLELGRYGREALGQRCRARIVEHFHIHRMTENYAALWRGLAGHHAGSMN